MIKLPCVELLYIDYSGTGNGVGHGICDGISEVFYDKQVGDFEATFDGSGNGNGLGVGSADDSNMAIW